MFYLCIRIIYYKSAGARSWGVCDIVLVSVGKFLINVKEKNIILDLIGRLFFTATSAAVKRICSMYTIFPLQSGRTIQKQKLTEKLDQK